MFIDTERSIVEFNFLKPQTLLGYVGINFTLQSALSDAPGNLQRLGMTSTNLLDNLLPYLFILGLFVISLMIASMFYFIPCLRDKTKSFLKE